MPQKKSTTTVKKAPKSKTVKPAVVTEAPRYGGWEKFVRRRFVGVTFAVLSGLVLLATTVYWTVLSARLQAANADQLVDAYLFGDIHTFREGLFPGAHTFLLKWPLFALVALLHSTFAAYLGMTLGLVLATVGVLVYLLYRIERRPAVFGLLCLMLASVLLMIPAQPVAGALLPVNWAMATTRNLEYALLLLCLWALARSRQLRSHALYMAIFLAALLIASDKLFAALILGSGAVVLVLSLLARKRAAPGRRTLAVRTLFIGIVAYLLAAITLSLINRLHLTHIVAGGASSPFGPVRSLKQLADALIYAVAAIFTNMGANPVHGTVVVANLPGDWLRSVRSTAMIPYTLNVCIMAAGIYAAIRVYRSRAQDRWTKLSVLLSGATLAALAVFTLTDHYYPVDARYLSVELFALFVALAAYLRIRRVPVMAGSVAGILVVLTLPLAMLHAHTEYAQSRTALLDRTALADRVAGELAQRHMTNIVGDYWYVTPVRAASMGAVRILPVDGCNDVHATLASRAWFELPAHTPLAYLVVGSAVDPLQTTTGCAQRQLLDTFGIPTENIELSSSSRATLWIYAKGAKPGAIQPTPPTHSSPKAMANLAPLQDCGQGTILNVVAHQDDDLLFLSPDLIYDVQVGKCVRTVYMTAGDAGESRGYWRGRELGSETAYAKMYGARNAWQQSQTLVNGHVVTVHTLAGQPHVALVFMHLPDGDIHGQGFMGDNKQSLKQLRDHRITTIRTVDGKTSYTEQALIDTLVAVMRTDHPTEIHTQDYSTDQYDGDHSDHHAAGYYTKLARSRYDPNLTLKTYAGYPSRKLPVNLSDEDIKMKESIFLAYGRHDGAVCHTTEECGNTFTYGNYLRREYWHTEP